MFVPRLFTLGFLCIAVLSHRVSGSADLILRTPSVPNEGLTAQEFHISQLRSAPGVLNWTLNGYIYSTLGGIPEQRPGTYCAPGDIPSFIEGHEWTCTEGIAGDLYYYSCANGQTIKYNIDFAPPLENAVGRPQGHQFVCAADLSGSEALGPESLCTTASVLKWNASQDLFECATDNNGLAVTARNCSNGQTPKFIGKEWICEDDLNSDILTQVIVSCPVSARFISYNNGAWGCYAHTNIMLDDPSLNQDCVGSPTDPKILKKDPNGCWQCASELNDDPIQELINNKSCGGADVYVHVAALGPPVSYECGIDHDTLDSINCSVNGNVAKFDPVKGWICVPDQNSDTYASLIHSIINGSTSCSDGNMLGRPRPPSTAAWGCVVDHNSLPVLFQECAINQTIKYNNCSNGFCYPVCANDLDDDPLATLSCQNGLVLKWNGTAWVCGVDEGCLPQCNNGDVAEYDTVEQAYVCAVDSDILATIGPTCANEDVVIWDASTSQWVCSPFDLKDDILTSLAESGSCKTGQIPKYVGGAWGCYQDNNYDVLYSLAFPTPNPTCQEAYVAKMFDINGVHTWLCAPDQDTDLLASLVDSCGNGYIPVSLGTNGSSAQWVCGPSPNTNILATLDCIPGEIPKYLSSQYGNSWFCASDQVGGDTYQGIANVRSGAANIGVSKSVWLSTDLPWGGGVTQEPIMLLPGRMEGISVTLNNNGNLGLSGNVKVIPTVNGSPLAAYSISIGPTSSSLNNGTVGNYVSWSTITDPTLSFTAGDQIGFMINATTLSLNHSTVGPDLAASLFLRL